MEIFDLGLGLILAGSAFGALTQLVGDLGRERSLAADRSTCIGRLHSVLAICLVPASLANLRAHRRLDSLDAALLAQIPSSSALIEGLSEFSVPEQVPEANYATLRLTIDIAVAMTRELGAASPNTATPDYERLAIAWREVVAAVIDFERLICATLRAKDLRLSASRLAFLNEMAFAVLEGGWPCVSTEGSVVSREELERRLNRRIKVAVAATMISGTTVAPATIADVSLTGLRLRTNAQLAIGTQISVGAHEIGLLAGRVVWSSREFMGIHFDPSARASAARFFDKALQSADRSADATSADTARLPLE